MTLCSISQELVSAENLGDGTQKRRSERGKIKMTLHNILAEKLSRMYDGESIVHTQDSITYSIEKHTAVYSSWYSYWENGNCLGTNLSMSEAIEMFIGK